ARLSARTAATLGARREVSRSSRVFAPPPTSSSRFRSHYQSVLEWRDCLEWRHGSSLRIRRACLRSIPPVSLAILTLTAEDWAHPDLRGRYPIEVVSPLCDRAFHGDSSPVRLRQLRVLQCSRS